MKYTTKLRDGDIDTVISSDIEVNIEDECIILSDTDGVLAVYPIKEVVKINKVVE